MAKAPHLAARLPGSLCHTALQFQIYCTYTGLSSSDSSPEPSETVGPAAAEMELQKDQLVARPARGLPKKPQTDFQGSRDLEEQLATEPTALLCNFRLDEKRCNFRLDEFSSLLP